MVKQGDIIWLDFDPQSGHEQKGRRPALVVSNEAFNNFSNLIIVCPITNTSKDHPLYVRLDKRTKTTGIILSNHIKALDINARNYEFIEKVPNDVLEKVVCFVGGFCEIEESD